MNTIETVQALQPETQSLAYSGRSIDYMDGYEAGFESAKDSILAQMKAAQSPAPVAVQSAALRMLTEGEVRTLMNSMFGKSPRDLPAAIQRAFAAANNLPLSASPEDKP